MGPTRVRAQAFWIVGKVGYLVPGGNVLDKFSTGRAQVRSDRPINAASLLRDQYIPGDQ
ncbi:MAG TPA: hypothetical protein VKA44_04705 [Gemmatimonadota bacterium]|nr:hypothetical protein [Gemmatimonadota bacterium]